MKTGTKKTFIYVPFLGLIEAADTMEETMLRVRIAEAEKERKNKKDLRRLQRENPGKIIRRAGDGWLIMGNSED
jgi:hypothetical protein